jgi:hypothetical protein
MKGLLAGQRPSTPALRVLNDRSFSPKAEPKVVLPFHPSRVSVDGIPAEIETVDGERVILLEAPISRRSLAVEAPFDGLTPSVVLESKLAAAAVIAMLKKMGEKRR